MKVEISYEGVVQYMKCSRRPFLEDVSLDRLNAL